MLRRLDDHRNEPRDSLPPDRRVATRILPDIEALRRAVAASSNKSIPNLNRPRSSSTGKSQQPTPPTPHAQSSIWNWKPLKALSLLRRRRFHCRFTVRVHSIRGLGASFEDRFLWVQWKRAGDRAGLAGARTKAVKVIKGIARFEEVMGHRCSVYGSKGGHHGSAKYEERQFVLFASVMGAPEMDLGKQKFDITRLLPLELEQMEGEDCTGEWTTSFKLSGKGKGAVMSVSFGFSVLKKGIEESNRGKDVILECLDVRRMGNSGNSPLNKDAKLIRETTLGDRLGILGNGEVGSGLVQASSIAADVLLEDKSSGADEHTKLEKVANEEERALQDGDLFVNDSAIEELAAAFDGLAIGMDCIPGNRDDSVAIGHSKMKSTYKMGKIVKSLSLDNFSESFSSEFLQLAHAKCSSPDRSSESDPESPRERLLRQFGRESLGGYFLDSPKEILKECGKEGLSAGDLKSPRECPHEQFEIVDDSMDLSALVEAAEAEHRKATQAMKSKARAKLLEDAEAKTLMREWGVDEKAFMNTPTDSNRGFGSPIELPPQDPVCLPPLEEGLGPFLQTKDGGFLRTMSPSLFEGAKNSGSLIMQVSYPVVVPAEMGSSAMDILQGLASVGIEKLSMQTHKLMPLENITGKTMQQIAWEALSAKEVNRRHDCFPLEKDCLLPGSKMEVGKRRINPSKMENGKSELVSIEELAPLAMEMMESLSLEGLRIQSGLSNEDAPSNVSPKSCSGTTNIGLKGAAGLQLMDAGNSAEEVDGLMALAITLDEWMRLDSGELNEEDLKSERTFKILAAHHAKSADLIDGGPWRGKQDGTGHRGKCGLLGNNFTVALMVQLRDPARNYEPVGTPMLALIQVERLLVPSKHKILRKVNDKGNSEECDDEAFERVPKSKGTVQYEESNSKFKITEVHVAGLKTEPGKKKSWGCPTQQSSGTRWLLANGMGKSNKHPFMKSKPVCRPSTSTAKVQPGDTLWSMSSRIHGKGDKTKELAALNPHIRNPDVIFPNQTIRLR